MRCVFDFSRVPGPSAERIITDGGEGVLVYSFNARQSDELLNEYRSAGLHVVWIWERNTDSIFDGYDFAVDECGLHEARVQPGELTYVACDTNDGGVAGRDLSPFLQGWSDTTREPRFGVYGSSGAIRQAQKFGGKCSRFWGVVNWINGGGPNNAPENISYWTNAHAHLIQLIGSPIDDTDQNMILQDDWWSLMSYRMPFDGDFPCYWLHLQEREYHQPGGLSSPAGRWTRRQAQLPVQSRAVSAKAIHLFSGAHRRRAT